MTLKEKIKQKVLNFLGLQHLSENPNNDRYTYLGNPESIIKAKAQENKIWYYGDSNELLNFYTAQETYGNTRNPIYNRNKQNYFWGLSSQEAKIKRVHSGVPNAIITTIVNLVGMPIISSLNQDELDNLMRATDFTKIINQKQLPMTLVVGWGCLKPIIDKTVDSNNPMLEWYDGEDVDFIKKHDRIIGVVFNDYYSYKNNNYVLTETRRILDGNAMFEYNLFRLDKNNDVIQVELNEVPELANLQNYTIKGLNKMMAIPSVFFYDQFNENGGRSVFTGKIDLFDDLDQDLSQASQTSRVSTPVEYFPIDLIERGKNGEARLPKIYNRQFISSNAYPNGDGELIGGDIRTTQPNLNFSQYNDKCMSDLDFILSGLLSPATFGLNIAKGDSAVAQREKEKVSIITRNNIIDQQQEIIKETLTQLLIFKEYLQKGYITTTEYDISVKFNDYANPTFETISPNLTYMLSNNALSPEMFVERLYGDSLSKEEKQREIDFVKQHIERETIDDIDFIEGVDENSIAEDVSSEPRISEEPTKD